MSPLAYEHFGRPSAVGGVAQDSPVLTDWAFDILFGCFDQPTPQMRARANAAEHAAIAYFAASTPHLCA